MATTSKYTIQDDVMYPKPSFEQIQMWKEIEASLNDEIIEVKAGFEALSDELRAYCASQKVAKEIGNIIQEYQIIDNTDYPVARIIGLVILGKIKITKFVQTLTEKCNLEQESAYQTARAINQRIFFPIKEDLKLIHNVSKWPEEGKEEAPGSPPSPQPPQQPAEPPIGGNVVNLKEK